MSPNLDFLSKLLESAKSAGATSADALFVEGTDLSASTRLGKLEDLERSEAKSFGLRVIIDQKQAMVSSTDCSEDAVASMVERAIAMARLATQDPYISLAGTEQLAKILPALDLYDEYEPSAEALIEQAKEAEDSALAVKGITNSEGGSASYGSSTIYFATSNGFSQAYKSSSSALSVSVIAGEGSSMQSDYDYSVARHRGNLKTPISIGKQAADYALGKMNPKKITTQNLPVVFHPRVAKTLLSNFASAINGAMIARGTSFLKERLHSQIFPTNINVIDDPFIVRGLGSRSFDAEGLLGQKMKLIKNGILTSWLLDIRTSSQLDMANTGNAARGISSQPSPSTSNLYLQNGTLPPEELIADIKSGVYITDMFGTGCNIITGDYSKGASGFYIENGKITHPISEFTIASNLLEMFKDLTAANDLEFLSSINTPTLRIANMVVAGI